MIFIRSSSALKFLCIAICNLQHISTEHNSYYLIINTPNSVHKMHADKWQIFYCNPFFPRLLFNNLDGKASFLSTRPHLGFVICPGLVNKSLCRFFSERTAVIKLHATPLGARFTTFATLMETLGIFSGIDSFILSSTVM